MAYNSTVPPHHNVLLRDDQIEVISKVYIAFLTPSLIGSFSVLLVSLLRWKNLQEQRQLLVQLALADLLASVLLLSVTVNNLKGYNSDLCLYGLPLALVFYILSFILAIVYAHKSKNVFRGWRTRPADCEDIQRREPLEKALYVFLWLCLSGLYIIYMFFVREKQICCSIKGETDCGRSCLLFSDVWDDGCPYYSFWHQEPMYLFLFVMAIIVILFCSVNYRTVSLQQQGLFPVEGDGLSRRRFKHVKYTTMKMLSIIIFCWTPALLLFLLKFSQYQESLYSLYIIQAITVSLQGFLNSLVYAWNRPNFTEAVLGERTPLITYHPASFFEESLKTSVWLSENSQKSRFDMKTEEEKHEVPGLNALKTSWK